MWLLVVGYRVCDSSLFTTSFTATRGKRDEFCWIKILQCIAHAHALQSRTPHKRRRKINQNKYQIRLMILKFFSNIFKNFSSKFRNFMAEKFFNLNFIITQLWWSGKVYKQNLVVIMTMVRWMLFECEKKRQQYQRTEYISVKVAYNSTVNTIHLTVRSNEGFNCQNHTSIDTYVVYARSDKQK